MNWNVYRHRHKGEANLWWLLVVAVVMVMLMPLFLDLPDEQDDGRPLGAGEICIKGVVYYNSGYWLAPAFNTDSQVITCDEKHSETKKEIR